MNNVVIASGVRTAVGRSIRGSFKDTRPDTLAGIVVKEALARVPSLKPEEVDDVIIGCARPEGEQGMNVARIAAFLAGVPYSVPAVTVNRFCASGLETITIAAAKISSGIADTIIAGGVESMTMVPMGGNKLTPNPHLMDTYPESGTPMGLTAEIVAKRFNVTREEQDRYAYESHMKAVKAIKEGKFKEEIIPVKARVLETKDDIPQVKEIVMDTDECPRADTTIEKLSQLRPAFAQNGTVTAGNSSPINDGAAAVVVMSENKAKALGITPLGFLRHAVAVGVPPEIMGTGPVPAVRKLLEKTGLKLEQIDLIEINEAFAAQSVYCVKELGLDPQKTNVNGGAIALGHPLGCTGTKLSVTLLYEMKRRGAKYGIVTMCIGGGQGMAGLYERM